MTLSHLRELVLLPSCLFFSQAPGAFSQLLDIFLVLTAPEVVPGVVLGLLLLPERCLELRDSIPATTALLG